MEALGTVAALEVDSALAQRVVPRLEGSVVWCDQRASREPPGDWVLRSDAVLLGDTLANPVQWAQQVHRVDKSIPVLILAPPERLAPLRRQILFSNHLGTEIQPFPLERLDELPEALCNAVVRRRQRRSYFGLIDSAQLQIGTLSLVQPEITYYLDRLLERAPLGVLSVDPGGSVLSLSRRAEAIFGVAEGEVLGRPVHTLFAASEQLRLLDLLRGIARGTLAPAPIELRVAGPRPMYVEATIAPLAYQAGRRGAILMLQDVSERIAAQFERARAEQELRAHVTVLSAFHRISSSGAMTLRERLHALLQFGCSQLQLSYALLTRVDGDALEVIDAISPNDNPLPGDVMPLANSYCALAYKRQEPLCVDDAAAPAGLRPARLEPPWVQVYLGTRVLLRGRPYGTLCFASPQRRDRPFSSTDRETLKLIAQWAGGALQQEADEAHMRMLSVGLEQAADAVVLTDASGRIEYVNPAFERQSGYAREEVNGRDAFAPDGGADADESYQELWRALGNGEVFRGVLPRRHKNGSVYLEERTVTPLRNPEGSVTHFIATGHDVTERARADEAARQHRRELAHVGRLSTLGEMTSGLAHELTQPLCAITTYAQTCLRLVKTGTVDLRELEYGLEQVVHQAELGGAIFARLRNFARKGEPARRNTSLGELIREAAGLLQADMAQQRIELRSIGRGDPVVRVDPIQIEQVFINLLRNGMDAMAAAGSRRRLLTIRHRRLRGERKLQVLISDTGPGCAPEVAARLFEPFFTTKPMGMGIGLGISQTIIEAHGGTLQLHANGAKGATFAFTLPDERSLDDDPEP